VPLHPLKPHVQFLRRPVIKDELVVGKAEEVEFKGARRTEAFRLQADPPQAIARRVRLERLAQ
jgi:hypothetical protein